ncbi:hypothetical protein [Candidatus Coxiella mudrowiae]|nr:hypothetical protein [Candidatus Coxiella mudrowiae]
MIMAGLIPNTLGTTINPDSAVNGSDSYIVKSVRIHAYLVRLGLNFGFAM